MNISNVHYIIITNIHLKGVLRAWPLHSMSVNLIGHLDYIHDSILVIYGLGVPQLYQTHYCNTILQSDKYYLDNHTSQSN